MSDLSPGMCESLHRLHERSDNPAYSATPWNGTYSATKAGLHLLTDALSMECNYLCENIKVILVVPGAIKSNIANNVSDYDLSPDSLFRQFTQIIHKRIATSQGANATAAEDFSQQVVSQVLKPNPPEYVTLGGFATVFAIAQWMPRCFVRWAMGKIWNKPNQP